MKSLALDGAVHGLGLQAEPASARLATSPLTGVTAVVDALLPERSKDARPIEPLVKEAFSEWLETQSDRTRRWAQSAGFKAEAGSICLVRQYMSLPEHRRARSVLVGRTGDRACSRA